MSIEKIIINNKATESLTILTDVVNNILTISVYRGNEIPAAVVASDETLTLTLKPTDSTESGE